MILIMLFEQVFNKLIFEIYRRNKMLYKNILKTIRWKTNLLTIRELTAHVSIFLIGV